MGLTVDLEKIQKVFARRGERVVLVLPDSEPLVLVPLSEYEQFGQAKLPLNPAETKNKKPAPAQPKPSAKTETIEQVDPLQGGLEDDDQYFPEPL